MASAYPNALDNFLTNRDNNTLMYDNHPQDHDDLADAVNKIEAEFGIHPRYSYLIPDYTIYKVPSSSNYAAKGARGLADVAPNANAAAVLTSCISNLGGFGTIEFTPGDYTWSSVPAIPRNFAAAGSMNPRWLRILGNGAKINLSSSGPRFLDYGRQDDYDTFANFELGGFVIDAAGSPAGPGNDQHIVIGTTVLGAQRCNFYHQWIHDIKAINISTGGNSTNSQHYGIWIQASHPTANEGTNNYMLGFRVERCRFEGGDTGILIAAAGPASGGTRIYGGNWYIADCWHNTGTIPTGVAPGSNYQLGGWIASHAAIDSHSSMTGPHAPDLVIERCYGCGSWDDGIETNGFMTINVVDCVIEDNWNEGYTSINYNFLNGIDHSANPRQQINYIRCVYRATSHDINPTAGNHGWEFTAVGYSDTGAINIVDCAYHCKVLDVGAIEQKLAIYVGPQGSFKISKIRVENFLASYDSVIHATATDSNLFCMIFNGPGPAELTLKDVHMHFVGSRTSTGHIFMHPLEIFGQDYILNIDGLTIHEEITGHFNDTTRCICIGENGWFEGGNSKAKGSIKNLRWANPASGDQYPRGVWVYSTTTCTITGKLYVEELDFTGVNVGDANEIYCDPTNAPFVFVRKTSWASGVQKAPQSLTVAGSGVAQRYLGLYSGYAHVIGGTVTLVEVSPDNTNWCTVGAGTNIGFWLENGWYYRFTYSVAPTASIMWRP